jgi:hypothetical protein
MDVDAPRLDPVPVAQERQQPRHGAPAELAHRDPHGRERRIEPAHVRHVVEADDRDGVRDASRRLERVAVIA